MALAASFSFFQWQETGYAMATRYECASRVRTLQQAQTATNAQGLAQNQAHTADAARNSISTLAANVDGCSSNKRISGD